MSAQQTGEQVWTEDYIESLPCEDNRIERKGSGIGSNEGKLREELSRQVSAFANTGGGNLLLGVANDGRIDGGLPITWKGRQATREWLEDVLPHLTDPSVVGCRVVDVRRNSQSSQIEANKAVFVIEIPDSEQAPHQSTVDLRYYVRLGSKSQPAPHRLIEDIRNRARHPKVQVESLAVVSAQSMRPSVQAREIYATFLFRLRNAGTVRAGNFCVLTRWNSVVSSAIAVDDREAAIRLSAEPRTSYVESRHPIYPSMEIALAVQFRFPIDVIRVTPGGSLDAYFGSRVRFQDLALFTAVFADNAPRIDREFRMVDVGQAEQLERAVVGTVQEFERGM